MDTLTEVLDHLRSAGALVGQSLMSPPWTVRLDEGASLTLVTMLRGEAWLVTAGAEAVHLGTRDLAVLTGPEPFDVASDPDRSAAPFYVLTASGACTDAAGTVLAEESVQLGVRTCGTHLDAEHALLTGSFTTTGRIAERLLGALPRVLVVPRERQRSPLLEVFEAEVARDEPGQQAVLDRLLELVLIGALRDWFALPEASAPRWYHAAADPVVGPALRAIHDEPARPWTVGTLAREARVSRATFARRFAELMGEPPISYLTGWRLCLASDLLQRTDDTIGSIARQVGYSGAYALSAAFTREYDVPPGRHRALAARRP
ncbi:AraC family transcriptional regulator [Micromonospora sp. WMMD882]|uniref:AraC family transcriptional regulator n=1 Tax=Micromonospora sp. WMMD882 TaxID=3015151 RepID=UPI00248BA9D5|nr:AraC family transcriptional regulator [Micromonospora sp. WMMD882]WBB77741.1 AraC family transcriptional regulator [Micromonospora sp. WMMD882]